MGRKNAVVAEEKCSFSYQAFWIIKGGVSQSGAELIHRMKYTVDIVGFSRDFKHVVHDSQKNRKYPSSPSETRLP